MTKQNSEALALLSDDDLRRIAAEVGMVAGHDRITMRSIGHAGGMTCEDGFAFARAAIEADRATHAANQVPAGFVLVPRELVEFLNGAAPIDGVWYGECHPEHKGLFWWRKALTAAAAPRATDQVAPEAAEVGQWTLIAPDGARFSGETPIRTARAAGQHHLKIDPEAQKRFLAVIEEARAEGQAERERCMADYGTLNCPACGGSGHIADAKANESLATTPASPQAPAPQAVVGEASELKGTFACPICGYDKPHGHSEEETSAHRDDQVRRDGFTSCVVRQPLESGWYLCTGVEVPAKEDDSQRHWFSWVRSYMQGYGRCDDIPEVLYWSANEQRWYLRNALGNAVLSGAENRRPVAVKVKRWRDLAALTPSPAPSAAPHQGADALREALVKARAHIVWLAFGECRSPGWDGAPPSALEAVSAIDAALAQHQAPQQGKQHE